MATNKKLFFTKMLECSCFVSSIVICFLANFDDKSVWDLRNTLKQQQLTTRLRRRKFIRFNVMSGIHVYCFLLILTFSEKVMTSICLVS